MAAERLDMRCVRDVLRLHFVAGQSPRAIGRSLGCGRTTAQRYLDRAYSNNLVNWIDIERLTEQELEIRLGFKEGVRACWLSDKVMPDWKRLHGELTKHKHLTLALLWQEYRS